jgi:hypothetical protein
MAINPATKLFPVVTIALLWIGPGCGKGSVPHTTDHAIESDTAWGVDAANGATVEVTNDERPDVATEGATGEVTGDERPDDAADGATFEVTRDERLDFSLLDGAGTVDRLTPDPWLEACSVYASAFCSLKQTCSSLAFHSLLGTVEKCEQRYGGTNCLAQMRSAGATVTPDQLAACAGAISMVTCADWSAGTAKVCSWLGTLPLASPCTYDDQCASGRCDLGNGTWCGTCKPKLLLGEDCLSPNLHACDSGLVCAEVPCALTATDGGTCSRSGLRWACVLPVAQGGECTTSFECNWGQSCVSGRCVPVRGRGRVYV